MIARPTEAKMYGGSMVADREREHAVCVRATAMKKKNTQTHSVTDVGRGRRRGRAYTNAYKREGYAS